MHISDGIGIPAVVLAGAGAASAGLAAALLVRLPAERIPRVALCTSFFFVASLVHVPVGPASVHLLLIGLVGIIMGREAFLPIGFGLVLQAFLLQHGGVSTLGVNALNMGLPAYAALWVFRAGRRSAPGIPPLVWGGLAGGLAVVLGALMVAGSLALAGKPLYGTAVAVAAAHVPVVVVEAVVTGFAAQFFSKVEPRMLEPNHA